MMKGLTPAVREKLSKVRLLLLDVDGVLTPGTLIWLQGQGFTRTFHIHDGYGIRTIQKMGLKVGVISGGSSTDLKERLAYLGIQHCVLGSEDKSKSLDLMCQETGIPPEETCFVGDDVFDLPALRRVMLSVSVPNAIDEVIEEVEWVTQRRGGEGAVREVIDEIRRAKNWGPLVAPK